MVTITPPTFIPPIGPTTSRSGDRNKGENFLKPGQLLNAMVLETKGANRFLLDISGQHLTAESRAALTSGQTLQLQVVKTTPQIELKIVTSTPDQFFGRSITLLGKNIDLTELFQAFKQQTPSPTSTLPPPTRNILNNFFALQQEILSDKNGGTVIKRLIDQLGLGFESALARGDKAAAGGSLKAALLDIANIFQNVENIAESTTRLLTIIELFQLAQVHNQSDRQFILPLPLPFIEQGYLLVKYNDGNKYDDRDSNLEKRFSLHLTMAELGNIQIDLLKIEDALYIRFRTDSQEKADFVALFSEQLKNAVSGTGHINLSFSADAPDPITDLIRQLIPEGNSIINTKA